MPEQPDAIRVTRPEDFGKTGDDAPYRAPAQPEIDAVCDLEDFLGDDGHELDGADPTADNVRRAAFAAQAVIAYSDATGNGDLDSAISDLLGDMQHLLDVLREWNEGEGLSGIDDLLAHGTLHYEAEIRGEL